MFKACVSNTTCCDSRSGQMPSSHNHFLQDWSRVRRTEFIGQLPRVRLFGLSQDTIWFQFPASFFFDIDIFLRDKISVQSLTDRGISSVEVFAFPCTNSLIYTHFCTYTTYTVCQKQASDHRFFVEVAKEEERTHTTKRVTASVPTDRRTPRERLPFFFFFFFPLATTYRLLRFYDIETTNFLFLSFFIGDVISPTQKPKFVNLFRIKATTTQGSLLDQILAENIKAQDYGVIWVIIKIPQYCPRILKEPLRCLSIPLIFWPPEDLRHSWSAAHIRTKYVRCSKCSLAHTSSRI